MIAGIIGGIGLFLLGMILMTDGLKAIAGDSLRGILERFVRGPISGIGWGAGITAIVQSSSATTLMTIGFVSAGLLTFAQSVGVILGANLGTTSTGWIVSTIGLKFSMSQIALPLIGIGAIMRLLGRTRSASIGVALAGFGLIFVGIDTLQAGMATLADRIDPGSFPGMTISGVPMLVIIGAVMTVVMQSSSAAVATTLAALHTGAIGLDQAAVLVIGQNIGTTVKAALASMGASIAARRTALAHILFNVITGLIALALLPVFLMLMRFVSERAQEDPGTVSLAAFHTAFNVVGVAVFVPVIRPFSRLIERMIPEHKPKLARHLDESVANLPAIAVETVRRTTMEIALAVVRAIRARLEQRMSKAEMNERLAEAEAAMEATQHFLGRISMEASSESVFRRHLSGLHAVDHLLRLVEACRDRPPMSTFEESESLERARERAIVPMGHVIDWLSGDREAPLTAEIEALSKSMAETRRRERHRLLEESAAGRMPPRKTVRQLEAFLWLDRVCFHLWRVVHHLERDAHADEAAFSETHADPSV